MKKTIYLVLCVVLIAGLMLTGCSGTQEQPSASPSASEAVPASDAASPSASTAAESAAPSDSVAAPASGDQIAWTAPTEKYKIGFANASVSNSWRVKMRTMLMDEAAKLGVEIVETDAHDDANTQNSNIEMMLQQDLDAILIAPCVEDAVNPGIEMAYASGIPVIIFDRHASTDQYTTFVGYSDEHNAELMAQMMVDALTAKYGSPKGNIIEFNSIAGSSTDNLNKKGWETVLSQYPDIKVVASAYTDFEVSKGKAFMEDCLTKFAPGQIDGFLSQDGGVTLGAWDAINEAGRQDEGFIIVNADGINGVCKLIKDGKCEGLTQLPCKCGVDALHEAIACLQGNMPSEKSIMMDSIVVNKDNVDEYLIPDGDDYDWTL
jgi:ABC-type sugar transport system substrate-binding protein